MMDRINYKYKIPCVYINSTVKLFLDGNLYTYIQTESGYKFVNALYPLTNVNYELALISTDTYMGYFYVND
jgi:hypothetical protein